MIENCSALSSKELIIINGGNPWGELSKKSPWFIVFYVVSTNYNTIKEAIADGWNGEYGCETCNTSGK